MAVSQWDKENLSQAQQNSIQKATDYGASTGDWATAHAMAETVRAQAGYSGGRYGDEYHKLPEKEPQVVYRQGGGSAYDLSDYLRQQQAAKTEAALANLKGAYDKSVAALDAGALNLPETYNAAKNEVAAQHARAKRTFDERAIAAGLNTGATGQATLARDSVLQAGLAGLSQDEAKAKADIDLRKADLLADYEAAVASAKANGATELADALYAELVRVQGLEREDEIRAAESASESLQLALKYGFSGSDTASVENRNETPDVAGNRGYDNGGLTTEQVKTLQEDINKYLPAGQKIAVDGKWGEATKAAAGGFSANEYANEYYRQNAWSGRSDR